MKRASIRLHASFVALFSLAGCVPEFDDDLSIVTAPRVLALRAEPAEDVPQAAVGLSALVAVPEGGIATVDWSLCVERKALTELGPVSPACLARSTGVSPALAPIGSGTSVQTTIPNDACRNFGPIRPEPKKNEPPGRPVDADTTGGYYQPVVGFLAETGATSLGAIRLRCDLAGATADQIVSFNTRYRRNQNPLVTSLAIVQGSELTDVVPDDSGTEHRTPIGAGARLRLRVSWPTCPRESACGDGVCGEGEDAVSCVGDCTPFRGCTGSESYVSFDPFVRSVVARREGIRISWFASAGHFQDERTGRSEAESETPWSENTWTAPSSGEARIWVVVRDDRGGVGWQSYTLEVAR